MSTLAIPKSLIRQGKRTRKGWMRSKTWRLLKMNGHDDAWTCLSQQTHMVLYQQRNISRRGQKDQRIEDLAHATSSLGSLIISPIANLELIMHLSKVSPLIIALFVDVGVVSTCCTNKSIICGILTCALMILSKHVLSNSDEDFSTTSSSYLLG
ncbi:hypothetical protein Tco_0620699 [Tanacetum coccineum]